MGSTSGPGEIYLLSNDHATTTGPFRSEEYGRPYVFKDEGGWMLCGWENGDVTIFYKNDFMSRNRTVRPYYLSVTDLFLTEGPLLWTCSDDGTMISTSVVLP